MLSDYDNIARRLADVEAHSDSGPIHMLVNCAGMAQCGTIADTSPAMARQMMDINYFGTFLPTRYVLEGMQRRNEGGIIVLTSSMAGMLGVYGMGAYCASKFALRGLAESLALENAHRGITVTLALPGDTDTPGYKVENETKPAITKLMSSEGGLVEPREMGRSIVDDALVSCNATSEESTTERTDYIVFVFIWSGAAWAFLLCVRFDRLGGGGHVCRSVAVGQRSAECADGIFGGAVAIVCSLHGAQFPAFGTRRSGQREIDERMSCFQTDELIGVGLIVCGIHSGNWWNLNVFELIFMLGLILGYLIITIIVS